MQGAAFLIEGLRLALGAAGVKHAAGLVGELLFPFGDLHRMHVELFSDLMMPLRASKATRALNWGSCLLRLAFIFSGWILG